jgi:hypothetical protein
MGNFIGKGLVLIHTILCLFGLGLALLVYFEFVDWGRSTPRLIAGEPAKGGPTGTRIASEFDKSLVIYQDALAGRNLVLAPIQPTEDSLREVEGRLGPNHLFYVAELKRLRSASEPIEVKGFPIGPAPTDAPGKAYGKAVPSVKVEGLERSIAASQEELKQELAKLDPLQEQLRELAKKNSDVTYQVTGRDEKGVKRTHGIFELVNQEFDTQQRLKAEREFIQPYTASVVEEARRYGIRRQGLEDTLNGLDQAIKERQKK